MAIIKVKEKIAEVDSFLMSCRVLGRGVEKSFLDYIIRELHKIGVEKISAKYIVTAKNLPAKDFYSAIDFTTLQSNEQETNYELQVDDYLNKHKFSSEQIKIII